MLFKSHARQFCELLFVVSMPIFVHKFSHALVRYCTDLIFFGTCEEKKFFTWALQIFKTYPRIDYWAVMFNTNFRCHFVAKVWLLNSESKDTFNMHVWFPVKKSLFRIAGIAYFNTSYVSHSCIYNLYDILCNHLMFYYVYMPLRGPFNLDQ